MPAIDGLGHVGIHTEDLLKMRDFYTRVMGLQIADENLDRGIVFLSANPAEEHHEFVLARGRDVPKGAKVVQQISFKVGSPQDIREYHERLQAENARIERFVSHGNALGLYFLDPEDNRIEVYYKTGFPVPQPHGDPLSMEASNEEWLATARAAIPAGQA
jgi:catechol 2,3-dioxygenase-like lactoylglutathione lyase family enzyme